MKPTPQNDDFLPKGYETPQAGANYMKLKEGENKFRILSKPIIGWIYWNLENKPVRIPGKDKPAVDDSLIRTDKGGKKSLKHFWAMIVWNYQDQAIQILEITQNGIQTAIETNYKDADWGAPYGYDISITRTGEGMSTEYMVTPKPHKALPNEIGEAFNKKGCDLQLLFKGEDPFSPKDNLTPMEMPF